MLQIVLRLPFQADLCFSDQLQPFQAHMAVLADDDVVVDSDIKCLRRVDDHLRHIDVSARRLFIRE
ncbi:hypothetical protein NXC14_CH02027 [Rhizobium sp. NXC14]|nr:hypothetical protein NXC14_CH02027 [Rhizobium sp. NXC14]